MVKVVKDGETIKWIYDPIEWEFMKACTKCAEALDIKIREILKQGENK